MLQRSAINVAFLLLYNFLFNFYSTKWKIFNFSHMFEFNANVFETNILNLRIVVGIVTVTLVDVLRNKVNQRRLLIRNTKLEILKKKYELQRELESFWVLERYIVEKCNFISESEKRSIKIELYKQMRNEKVQKKLYQEKYNKALLAKTEQMKRLLVRDTFASAIRRAKNILKEEFYINVELGTFVYFMFFLMKAPYEDGSSPTKILSAKIATEI